MNGRYVLGVALLSGALIAGCSTGNPQVSDAPVWADQTSQGAQQPVYGDQDLNERSNLQKELGQPASIMNVDQSVLLDFAVTEIREINCRSYSPGSPENGRFIQVDVVVNTHDDPDQLLQWILFSNGWEHIAADGTSVQADTISAAMCSTELAPELRPNRKYSTSIVLDIPATPGGMISWASLPTVGGWEWRVTV